QLLPGITTQSLIKPMASSNVCTRSAANTCVINSYSTGPLCKLNVRDQLSFARVARNVTLAGCVFRKHDAAGGNATNVAIARLELDFAGEPNHKHAAWRIVPTHTLRLSTGKGPSTVQDLGAWAIEPHHVVPARHGR